METKLFQETDTWGDSSGNAGALSFSAKKKDKSKKSKNKKRKHSEIDNDPSAGMWVR
jgi:hypothetical protein